MQVDGLRTHQPVAQDANVCTSERGGIMSIQMRTLYEAVKDKKEYEIKLLAGEKGLDNTVSWVHVVERKELSTFLEG